MCYFLTDSTLDYTQHILHSTEANRVVVLRMLAESIQLFRQVNDIYGDNFIAKSHKYAFSLSAFKLKSNIVWLNIPNCTYTLAYNKEWRNLMHLKWEKIYENPPDVTKELFLWLKYCYLSARIILPYFDLSQIGDDVNKVNCTLIWGRNPQMKCNTPAAFKEM